MKCTTCNGPATGLASITENVHERQCEGCISDWEASVNRRLFEQHVKEGREGAALSEFRSWQALRSRRAA